MIDQKVVEIIRPCMAMQVATVSENKPWIASVYFVVYQGNLFWLSEPTRRHSQDIDSNHNTAVAIAVKNTQPVIGFQAEGRARAVLDRQTIDLVMPFYIKKYNMGKEFAKRFRDGINKHQLYCMVIESYHIFNE